MLLVNPVTVIVPDPAWATVPVIPPGLDVAVYNVIGEPPALTGAVYATFIEVPDTTVAVPIVGAPAKTFATNPDSGSELSIPNLGIL